MSDDAAGSSNAERGLAGSQQAVASFDEEHQGLVRQVQGFLHKYPTSIPLIVLLLGVVIFTIAAPGKFLSPLNLSVVLQQVTIVAILGMAQTLVILTAGIDLSVGLIMILCSVVMGRTAVVYGVPVIIAFPLGLLVRARLRLLNGLIVTRLRLPPFIVTLGTWSIFGALNTWYSNSETIRSQDMEAAAPFLLWLGKLFKLYDLGMAVGLDLPFLQGLGGHLRLGADDRARDHPVLRAVANGVRPPCLCDRRRSRRRAAFGHQHRPHAAGGLRARRPDLRHRPPGR